MWTNEPKTECAQENLEKKSFGSTLVKTGKKSYDLKISEIESESEYRSKLSFSKEDDFVSDPNYVSKYVNTFVQRGVVTNTLKQLSTNNNIRDRTLGGEKLGPGIYTVINNFLFFLKN